jgi:hypothetical protein
MADRVDFYFRQRVTEAELAPAPPIFELPALSLAAIEIPDDARQPLGRTATRNTEPASARSRFPWSRRHRRRGRRRGHRSFGGVAEMPWCRARQHLDYRLGSYRRKRDRVRFGRVAMGFLYLGRQWTTLAQREPRRRRHRPRHCRELRLARHPFQQLRGVGLYFSSASCLDASAYAGLAFEFAGGLGACVLRLAVSFSDDVSVINDPVRGVCTAGSSGCYPPFAALVPGSTTIRVPFAALTSGMPVDQVDVTTIIGVEWQLSAPLDAGGCTASFTVADAALY